MAKKKTRRGKKLLLLACLVVLILLVGYVCVIFSYYRKVSKLNNSEALSNASGVCIFENMGSTSPDQIQATLTKIDGKDLKAAISSAENELRQREKLGRITFWTNAYGLKDKYFALNAIINDTKENCEDTQMLVQGIDEYNNGNYLYARNLTYAVADKYKNDNDVIYLYASIYEASSRFRSGQGNPYVSDASNIYSQALNKQSDHNFPGDYLFGYNLFASDYISIEDYSNAIKVATDGINRFGNEKSTWDQNYNLQLSQLYYSRAYAYTLINNYKSGKSDVEKSLSYYNLESAQNLYKILNSSPSTKTSSTNTIPRSTQDRIDKIWSDLRENISQ